MRYRQVFLIVLLMFLTLTFLFFYNIRGLFSNIEEELFAYLEKNHQIEVEVGSFIFWPVNQMTLKDVKINSLEKKFSISTPELNIYYNLFSFLTDGNLAIALNYINLESPHIEINNDLDELPADFDILEFLAGIPFLSSAQLRINAGSLSYTDQNNQVSLAEIDLLAKSSSDGEYQVKIESKLDLNRMEWQEYRLEKLKVDNLTLALSMKDGKWKALLESEFINLDGFITSPVELELDSLKLVADKIRGELKPLIHLSGNQAVVESYSGTFFIRDSRGKFSYLEQGGEERFILEDISGALGFDSKEAALYTEGIEFSLNGNPVKISGRIDELLTDNMEIIAHLKSNQFQPGELDFLPGYMNFDGIVALDISLAGRVDNLAMNLDLSMAEGSINNISLENLTGKLRYNQGNFYLDKLNFILGDTGQISVNGIYNRNHNYSFYLEGHYIDLSLLQKSGITGQDSLVSLPALELSGKLNIMANLVGHGLARAELLASGELEIVEPEIHLPSLGFNFTKLKSSFYLTGRRLLLREGELSGQWGKLAFGGELGPELDLDFYGDSLNPAVLLAETSLDIEPDPDLKGKLRLSGTVQGDLASPRLELSLLSEEGTLYGMHYDSLSARLNYIDGEVTVEELTLNYLDNLIQGTASIGLPSGKPFINALISSDSLDIKTILNMAGGEVRGIPLNGTLAAKVNITGPLDQPEIFISGRSGNAGLYINKREIVFDELSFYLKKVKGAFLLEEFLLKKAEALLSAGGTVSGLELALDYSLQDLPLADLAGFSFLESLDGRINIEGRVSGSLLDPAVSGRLDIQNLFYQDKSLGFVQGNLYYYAGDIGLDSISWKNGGQEYRVQGRIKDFLQEPYLDLTVNTRNGRTKDLFFLDLPPDLEDLFFADYYLSGDGYLGGTLEDISAWLDLQLVNIESEDSKVILTGNFYPGLDLYIVGEDIKIDRLLQKYLDAGISGKLAVAGEMRGSLHSLNLLLETRVEDMSVEDIYIDSIQGSLELRNGGLLTLQQFLAVSEGQSLRLNGTMDLKREKRTKARLELRHFPLELLSALDSSFPAMAGLLSGELALNTNFTGKDIELNGRLYLEEGAVDFNFPDTFSGLRGIVDLQGEIISLENLKGNYGTGLVEIEGIIKPFAADDNLALRLKGKDLPFAHGSIEGYFDGTGRLSGSFSGPMIEAELLAHHLDVRLPFTWPVSGGGGGYWKYDLLLSPGTEVYLVNNNINVLIQEGSLKVQNTGGQLALIGELYSSQGSFDFYNNKFFLQNGMARFEQSFVEKDRYIPYMNINAWTNIGGARINVQLNGKSNNMIATFSSSPPLSEEEILTLLTSKGGLGEFVSGNLGDVLYREFFRWLHNQIQVDYIIDVQEALRKAFELDRFELDTYNWLLGNQISLYIGKHLSNRLYLEYVSILGDEETLLFDDYGRELKLQYFLDENVILEGSWQGEENYSISIETKYQF